MPGVQTFVDAETGHWLAVKMAAYGLTPRFGSNHKTYDSLKCDFLGMRLNNPIGELFTNTSSSKERVRLQELPPVSTRTVKRFAAWRTAASDLWRSDRSLRCRKRGIRSRECSGCSRIE